MLSVGGVNPGKRPMEVADETQTPKQMPKWAQIVARLRQSPFH